MRKKSVQVQDEEEEKDNEKDWKRGESCGRSVNYVLMTR